MADIRVKDLDETSVPGADYYLLTDSATDGVKRIKTSNVVSKSDIGLGNVDNTSDNDKPISSATQTALDEKATSAQGAKADSAVQPGDLGDLALKDKAAISDLSATGTPSSTTALFGDGTWKTPAGAGDMVGATYDPDGVGADAFSSSNTKFIQGGTSPLVLSVQEELRRHAVRPDQFLLGTDSDDTASFLRARDRAMAQGLPIRIRGGSYTLSETIEIDVSDQTTFDGYGRYSLIGDGPGVTELIWAGNDVSAIKLVGGTSGAALEQYGIIKGFKVRTATPGIANGIEVNIGGAIHIEDVLTVNLNNGIILFDALSSLFSNVSCRWGNTGISAVYNTVTRPNALTLVACRLGHNAESAVYIEGGSQFDMFGGSIEGNGHSGVNPVRGGVRIFGPSVEGSVAANFNGVYFEANEPHADIHMTVGTDPTVLNVIGCNFNRVGDENYVTNNIHVIGSTAGDTIVNVFGSSFRGYGAYTPSSSRPYIKMDMTSTNYTLNASPTCNYFASTTEAPQDASGVMPASAAPVAKCRFNGTLSSPVMKNGYNVASVTKNGTGDYTVTLMRGTGLTGKTPHVSTNDFASTIQILGEGSNSVRFLVVTAGAAADASNVLVTVFDG